MVSFKSYSLHALILLVLFFITPSASLSAKVTEDDIKDICSKTQDPSFCLSVLNPQANKVDLQGLAKITIDLASSNAKKTLQLIRSLIPKTTDSKLKSRYKTCSEHFDNAIGNLADAQEDLRIGDPNGVNLSASASMDEAGDCEDELKRLPADPSILKGSQDLNKIDSIILVVSNLLPR